MKSIDFNLGRPFWEISGETDFPTLLLALEELLPAGGVLYFEGGKPDRELLEFLREYQIPEQAHIHPATIWPKPNVFHLPVMPVTLTGLAELMASRAEPELACHFHVYRERDVLLPWHDAFFQEMLISGELPEGKVMAFAERLGMIIQTGNVQT